MRYRMGLGNHRGLGCMGCSGVYRLPNGVAPLIFADFKNGVYEANGASMTLGDLLIEDTDFGTWDPSLVVAGTGFTNPGASSANGPVLAPGLSTFIGEGCTLVPTFSQRDQGDMRLFMLDLPAYNNEFWGAVTRQYSGVSDGSGTFVQDTFANVTKAAFNISLTRVAGSVNGRPVFGMDPTYDATGTPFNTSAIVVENSFVLETLGWYPLQPEADLVTLSTL
jgi:hypothetical protein